MCCLGGVREHGVGPGKRVGRQSASREGEGGGRRWYRWHHTDGSCRLRPEEGAAPWRGGRLGAWVRISLGRCVARGRALLPAGRAGCRRAGPQGGCGGKRIGARLAVSLSWVGARSGASREGSTWQARESVGLCVRTRAEPRAAPGGRSHAGGRAGPPAWAAGRRRGRRLCRLQGAMASRRSVLGCGPKRPPSCCAGCSASRPPTHRLAEASIHSWGEGTE